MEITNSLEQKPFTDDTPVVQEINAVDNSDKWIRQSKKYIITSALLFAVVRMLCQLDLIWDYFTVLILPLGVFFAYTAWYFNARINSLTDISSSKQDGYKLCLTLYIIVSCALLWLVRYERKKIVGFFFDIEPYEDYLEGFRIIFPNGLFYERRCQVAFIMALTAVYLPCLIDAYKCLVTNMKERVAVADDAQAEMKKQRKSFLGIYTVTLLMVPMVIFALFVPMLLLQRLSIRWRKNKFLFWLTQAICWTVLIGLLVAGTLYYIY